MQKGMYINEIDQKYVGFALLKRDLPPPNVKNKFIKNWFLLQQSCKQTDARNEEKKHFWTSSVTVHTHKCLTTFLAAKSKNAI